MSAETAARRIRGVERLMHLVNTLNPDELDVLVAVGTRLERGRATYGPLTLATDGRDWRQEAREELLDALVYRAIGDVASTAT